MMNKRLRGLYVITDPTLCEDKLIEKVEQAIIGGAQIVQYRNKQAPEEKQSTYIGAEAQNDLKKRRY